MAKKKVTGTEKASAGVNVKKRGADAQEAADNESKRPRIAEKTDPTRWRMRDDESRHTWHYLESDEAIKEWPQSYADKYFLGLPLVCPISIQLLDNC
jgi:lanosterol synthase